MVKCTAYAQLDSVGIFEEVVHQVVTVIVAHNISQCLFTYRRIKVSASQNAEFQILCNGAVWNGYLTFG